MARGVVRNDVFELSVQIDEKAIQDLARGESVTEILTTVGQIGEASAKSHAPVKTGNLRRSITYEVGSTGRTQYARIGTNIFYALFQEVGTRFHAAQPFLRPALADVERALR